VRPVALFLDRQNHREEARKDAATELAQAAKSQIPGQPAFNDTLARSSYGWNSLSGES
jgi:hypothetical protein